MKATKLVTTAAVATLGFTFLAPSVLAADAKNTTGKGKVSYTTDNTPTGPKDPEEDKITIIPGPDEVVTNPESGPLRVDMVTNLDFDQQTIGTAKGLYNAKASKIKGTREGDPTEFDVIRGNYVQVTDKRAADETTNKSKGWELSAKLSKQFTSGTSVLKGSTITYKDPVVTYSGEPGSKTNPRKDLLADAANGFEKLAMTELSRDDDKDTSAEVKMLKSNPGSGFGTYFLQFGRNAEYGGTLNGADTTASSVTLMVPANTQMKEAAYESEITWTISELNVQP